MSLRVKQNNVMARRIRHKRVRKRVFGTSSRPRLCVFRSLKHIYAQVIDDSSGQTLAFISTLNPHFHAIAGQGSDSQLSEGSQKETHGMTRAEQARAVGSLLAQKALSQGITKVVFDRGGYKYHGRIKALADAAREAGLSF